MQRPEPQPERKALFLGNYLSARRGTTGPAEILAEHLPKAGIAAKLVSSQEPRLLRAADILFHVLSTRAGVVCADVFSGNVHTILPLVGRIAAFREKPLVLVLHGGQLPEHFERSPEAISRLFRRARRLITPSLYLKAFFEEMGFDVRYLPNPVPLEHFPYAAPAPASPPRLLWVRAFADIYRPELAVDILGELRRSHPAATLTMIGPDVGTLDKVWAHIAHKGLEDAIRVVGPIPHRQLGKFYRTHSVFLNTTQYESFGSAVLEAAASGIPVVSSAVGNIPLLWEDGKEILLAKQPAAGEFSAQIRRILTEPGLSARLSENARLKASQFDVEIVLQNWAGLFNNILA